MNIGLLGYKIGMTRIFDENGNIIPITILKVGPCIITQIKTKEKHDYDSIQIGYKNILNKVLTQPKLGHFRKSKLSSLKYLKEFKVSNIHKFYLGQELTLDLFTLACSVNITGKTIGKGFAGLSKRYNFSRGPMTHGSKNHKAPGSIGMGTTPGRVFPNKKMPGHLGDKNQSIKCLKIIKLNLKENILIVKGSVPGKIGNLLTIYPNKLN